MSLSAFTRHCDVVIMVDRFLHELTYPRSFSGHGWGEIVSQPRTYPGKDPFIQQHT
jgi:hypothetical protein